MTSATHHYAIGDDSATSKADPGRRVQWLRTVADVEASDLTEDEKIGLAPFLDANQHYDLDGLPDHGALKKREPIIAIMQRDPEVAGIYVQMYNPLALMVTGLDNEQLGLATTRPAGVRGVTDDPEVIHKFEIAMLFVTAVCYERRDEWTLRLMATAPQFLGPEKCAMLGYPESSVWSDEERLVLEFTHAVKAGDISDELFDRAKAAWGIKGIVRYTSWIGTYEWTLMLGILNVSDADKRAALRAE